MTLIEVLIAAVISVMVLGVVLAMTMSSRQISNVDSLRTDLNQNLRAGMDLIGTDIRISGERLGTRSGSQVTAIEVIGGSELVLRRNLVDAVLPVCADDQNQFATGTSILVASTDADFLLANPRCQVIDNEVPAGWPDNVTAWRNLRLANGGSMRAYLFTPAGGGQGEFFTYDGETAVPAAIQRNATAWANTYDIADGVRLYLLEERRYRLVGNVLEVIVNGNDTAPLRLINDVSDFQVRAVMRNGDVRTDLGSAQSWTNVAAIEISISGAVTRQRTDVERTLTSRFFPRNVLSN
ncbi:MAG: prepilin-type cleavage/methylation domain-containing protein [Trueperaceae bacterium]|nr:prepilin-type cleavage/methylation domain-containing protein [Trueperaceae bacterium]